MTLPADLAVLDLISQPIWVFDPAAYRVLWANRPALALWQAESLDELVARDFGSDTPAMRSRFRQIAESAPDGASVEETWTLYPNDQPVRVLARMTPVELGPERLGVLVEASRVADIAGDPYHVRMSEATRYTPLMVTTLTAAGRILAQNPAALQAYGGLGGHGNEQDGEAWRRRFLVADDADLMVSRCLADGRLEDTVQVRTIDGVRWHRLDACRGRDPVTGDDCVVVTESDVSDRIDARLALERMTEELDGEVRRRTRELEHAKQQAEAASVAKSGFLANVSHELRTPLNAIMGFAELLLQPAMMDAHPERRREYADSILLSGRLLLNLIDDILDLSRIEARRMRLLIEPVVLADMLAECETIVRPLAQGGGIALDVVRAPSDLQVLCDRRALTQVILNLVSNSLKFTPQGGSVRIAMRQEPPGYVLITVSDSGCGIAAADLPHVIEPFAQAANPMVRRAKGHGLGLPIAKQLVELMGGRFDLASSVGEGTTVTLALAAVDRAEAGTRG